MKPVLWLLAGISVPALLLVGVIKQFPGLLAPEGFLGSDSRMSGELGVPAGSPLANEDLADLSRIVAGLWNGGTLSELGRVPARLGEPGQPVFVSARAGGRRVGLVCEEGGLSVGENLAAALEGLQKSVGTKLSRVDTLYVELSHSFREVSFDELLMPEFQCSRRGAVGIEIRRGSQVLRYSPSLMIDTNRGASRVREMFVKEFRLDSQAMAGVAFKYRTFLTEEVLVTLRNPPVAKLLFRGNEIVDVAEVTAQRMEKWTELSMGWLKNNLNASGRMTYIYWPSMGQEAPKSSNNMIRQWMATVALGRYAADRKDPAAWRMAARNIDFNLSQYYREKAGLGLMEWEGQVKLGALALATLALVEHPQREKWARQETAMRRSIDRLWHKDGSFTSFLIPAGMGGNENFYPGEALLLWATLYEQTRDPVLLEKCMTSFRYYRRWHRDPKNRNPAFIPWHTQAYYKIWKITGNQELRDFVFEMNDWLLGIQQWDNANYPDERGQFYDGRRPFGPPHASSTGVYLEGLIDAFSMARALGDAKRTETYRVALVRGMRSMLQLQFADETDMFYISTAKRPKVLGGLRTTVYSNEIRCDNIQHPFMGVLKLMREFRPEDYKHPAMAVKAVLPVPAKASPDFPVRGQTYGELGGNGD